MCPNFFAPASKASLCSRQFARSHWWKENRGEDVRELGALDTGGLRSRTMILLSGQIECNKMAVCSPMPELPPVMRVTLLVGDLRSEGLTVNASVAAIT